MVALDEPEIRLALKNKSDPIKKVTQDLFKIMKVEKTKNYQKIVNQIVKKYKGLYFNNELFVIEKK